MPRPKAWHEGPVATYGDIWRRKPSGGHVAPGNPNKGIRMHADPEGPTGPRPCLERPQTFVPTGEFRPLRGVTPEGEHLVEETRETSLIQFLKERCQYPETLIHRWIRTGQVLLNGSRARAEAKVRPGDALRLPKWLESVQEGRQGS